MRNRIIELSLALALYAGVASAQSTGYELALSGTPVAMPGEHLRLAGTVFEVQGLAALRPLGGGRVHASLHSTGPGRADDVVVAEGDFVADGAGRVILDLAVPAAALPTGLTLVTRIGRPGERSPRELTFHVSVHPAVRIDLITDRVRYEPGETLHAFALVRRMSTGQPVRDATVHATLSGPNGAVLETDVPLRASGAFVLDAPFAATTPNGAYTLSLRYVGGGSTATASRTVQVEQRTVERMLVTASVDQAVVAPGTELTGSVFVRSASGTPIAGVGVNVSLDAVDVSVTTDAEGRATFRIRAPSYLSGDVQRMRVAVRVEHAAYGTRIEFVPVVVARSPYRVEVVAQGGALVLDVSTTAFVHVVDPLGAPAPAGLVVEATGVGVRGGPFRGVTDADGFVAVPMHVPTGASSRFDEGPCSGGHAVELALTLHASRPYSVDACAKVSLEAQVAVRAQNSVVQPGGTLAVDIGRTPARAGDEVIVELLLDGRVIAATILAGSATRGQLPVPRDANGVLLIRARPLGRASAVPGLDELGATAFGTGSMDAVLVRPADAFNLDLRTQEEPFAVRGTARIEYHLSRDSSDAFVTFVARDLAQHGGEGDYVLNWLGRFYEAAIVAPSEQPRDALLRATLAASLRPDPAALGVGPLNVRPWLPEGGSSEPDGARGELRDPFKSRDELLRRQSGELMVAIADALSEEYARVGLRDEDDGDDDDGEEGEVEEQDDRLLTSTGGFPPDLVARLVRLGHLSEERVETLGGRPMTLAMLQSADPSFRAENVAARFCRGQLVRAMLTLLAYTDPDSEGGARALAGLPPARWLSRLVELGALTPEQLRDPWGHALVFRPATGGTPRYVLSDRAPTYELISLGPDGRAGSRDDVRDPFARILPAGSPFAVASGEDQLLASVAAISPGPSALGGMLRAYATVSLEARDEGREGAVGAFASEEYGDSPTPMAAAFDDDMMGGALMGRASGAGYGMGAGELGDRSSGMRMRSMLSARPAGAAPPPPPPPSPGSSLARVGELVRERFPATLLFVGERALSREGSFDIPLADALTTYRVEGIAWTASGWLTVARTEFRVDQIATVDAVVPEYATVGDLLRVPVRVENRGRTPLRARIGIAAEGIDVEGGEVRSVEVPARDVLEATVELRVRAAGRGQLVVRLVGEDDSPLDATRRPIVAYPDSRLVHESMRRFVEGATVLTFETPADAVERDAGEVRIATGFDFFGGLPTGNAPVTVLRAYARLVAGIEPSDVDRTIAIELVQNAISVHAGSGDYRPDGAYDIGALARALSVAYGSAGLGDEAVVNAAELLSAFLPAEGTVMDSGLLSRHADALLYLAPLVRRRAERPLPPALTAVVDRLRVLVRDGSAFASEDILLSVHAAAALAMTRGASRDARADELLRRLDTYVIRGSQGRFLEASVVGEAHARELPTALLALAYVGQGDRAAAFDAFRGLVNRPERTLTQEAQLHAAIVAGILLSGDVSQLAIRLDGQPLALVTAGSERVAALPGFGRAGTHRLEVILPEGGAALLQLEVRYGRPWDGAEARRLPLRLTVAGEVGARDTRAGLAVEVRNEGARLLRSPIVEVDLPAGAELDDDARGALRTQTITPPTLEGRTLRLALRPMAPGGRVRIPLRLRWSLGGDLRGLGVTAYDDVAQSGDLVARAVLPSRAVALADHGAEPVAAEAEADAPPPTRPPPVPYLRTLTPAPEVTR